MTRPELALWSALRGKGSRLRFRRQHAAGNYVLDFYCAPAKLAIEVDGEAHERGDRPVRDAVRDAWLERQGIRTLRYAARDVLTNLDGVLSQISMVAVERQRAFAAAVRPPLPGTFVPPPPGGGG